MKALLDVLLEAAARETFLREWHHKRGPINYPLVNAIAAVAYRGGAHIWEPSRSTSEDSW